MTIHAASIKSRHEMQRGEVGGNAQSQFSQSVNVCHHVIIWAGADSESSDYLAQYKLVYLLTYILTYLFTYLLAYGTTEQSLLGQRDFGKFGSQEDYRGIFRLYTYWQQSGLWCSSCIIVFWPLHC